MFARGPAADAFVHEYGVLRAGDDEVPARVELHDRLGRAEIAAILAGFGNDYVGHMKRTAPTRVDARAVSSAHRPTP